VRWKTVSDSTRGWISGTNCTAEAPLPIVATRAPPRSCSWSQREEWKTLPSKLFSPGSSGMTGSLQGPVAETITRAAYSPVLVRINQR
jgi:hypothetical protein